MIVSVRLSGVNTTSTRLFHPDGTIGHAYVSDNGRCFRYFEETLDANRSREKRKRARDRLVQRGVVRIAGQEGDLAPLAAQDVPPEFLGFGDEDVTRFPGHDEPGALVNLGLELSR